MSVELTDVRRVPAVEQIRGLAPDHATLRTADELIRTGSWGRCGVSEIDGDAGDRLLWAEFPEARRLPIRTSVTLPDMQLTCSCAAARFPCRHTIALLLREATEGLDHAVSPEWAPPAGRGRTPDPQAVDPAAEAARHGALVAGMADLRRWLADLAAQGLAGLPKRGRNLWLNAANRLVDAYAFEPARELRELSLIPGSRADWPERILPRIGRLALLCDAFTRLDALPPAERGDVLTAAGRPPRPDSPPVRDDWLVIGRGMEIEQRKIRGRTWLYGIASRRWALVADTYTISRLGGVCLPAGAVFSGELGFSPSAHPLVARPVENLRLAPSTMTRQTLFSSGIAEGMAQYASALAANPWLRAYPLVLNDIFVEPPAPSNGSAWRLRDRRGWLLPLPATFAHGWRLLSLAADHPVSLFGEWDGAQFLPMSVFDGGWRSMAGWRGLT